MPNSLRAIIIKRVGRARLQVLDDQRRSSLRAFERTEDDARRDRVETGRPRGKSVIRLALVSVPM